MTAYLSCCLTFLNVANAAPTVEAPDTSDTPDTESATPDEREANTPDGIDHSTSWEDDDSQAVISEPEPPPAVNPPPDDPVYTAKMRSGNALVISGGVFMGAGGVAVVLLSFPAWIAAQVARDRASKNPILVSKSELQRREENRLRFARISAIAGGSALMVGGILLAAGLGVRASAKRERAVTVIPMMGPTRGLALDVRF